MPFNFEGRYKSRIANQTLKQLSNSLNVSLVLSNERIFKMINANTPVIEAFSLVNKDLINSLESLIDLIYNPGIINIDFADLRSILNGRGNIAFLNTISVAGNNKLEKAGQEILHNPLYHNNNFTAEKILFNITGGSNLSMIEVDKISRIIGQQNPRAKIIFGISKNPKYKNKIKVTLLMVGLPTTKKLPVAKEKGVKKKIEKKRKILIKNKSTPKNKEGVPMDNVVGSVLNTVPVTLANTIQQSVTETSPTQKKTIRRTALEIKKAQELEEKEKSRQEKEWEIPAFLRFKKVK